MFSSIIYIFFAILALSFLIFIHELGHYYVARRTGMRVETFAIGFGRPIFSWVRDGVKWQIGWLLFGGYVKIAGMEGDDAEKDPYAMKDGFFGKKPLDRIKVLFAGPFVNIVFALLVFSFLWVIGGREKNFGEFTNRIGWVDPHSELYADGVRPGDVILAYDNHSYLSSKDHLYAPMTASGEMDVKGLKVDYAAGESEPFDYKIKPYTHPAALQKGIFTTGILQSASYVFYNRLANGAENPLPEGSPMENSGIQYGDRVLWVDGELIFSRDQLDHVLNDGKVLLTVQRDGEILLARVPRVLVQELKLDPEFKEELVDWQFEAELNRTRIQKLYAIPYHLTNNCVVESEAKFIDKENQQEAFPAHPFSKIESPLLAGDKILAADGVAVKRSYELLLQLQKHNVSVIVERDNQLSRKVPWKKADATFNEDINWKDLHAITHSIGTGAPVNQAGDLYLLKPVIPKMRSEFALSPEKQAWLAAEMLEQKKAVEAIEDPERRAHALHLLAHKEKQLLLGLPIQDRRVDYNPNPIDLFANVFTEIWRTLVALFTGSVNPKWLSGPIGIVQVVYDSWLVSFKDALFWIGAISLNLGVLNLLPIPVLDGGTIMLTFFEMISGKRLKPKTLEKLVIPFAVLLIGLFIYFTFNDLSRLFGGYFH